MSYADRFMDAGAIATRFRTALNRLFLRAGFPRNWWLIPLAAVIGAASGAVALAYGYLVHAAAGFFYGHEEGRNLSGARVWLIVGLPVAGALIVGLIKAAFRLPLRSFFEVNRREVRDRERRWRA